MLGESVRKFRYFNSHFNDGNSFLDDAKKFGWQFPKEPVTHSWQKMQQAVADYIGGLNWSYRTSLRTNNVTYFNSYGVFSGSHEITATNNRGKVEKLTADRFLVAVGLRPRYPDVPGAKEYCITRFVHFTKYSSFGTF